MALFTDLEAQVLALIEDIDLDLEEREALDRLRKLIAVWDKPALGAYRDRAMRAAA
jgi:hypothetical protein